MRNARVAGHLPNSGHLVIHDLGHAGLAPIRFAFGPGETYDFEINAPPGEIRIEVKSLNDFEVRPVQQATSAPAPGRTSRPGPDAADPEDIR